MSKSSGRTFLPITAKELHEKIAAVYERLKDADGYVKDMMGHSTSDLLRAHVEAIIVDGYLTKDLKVEMDLENLECDPGDEPRGMDGALGFQTLSNGLTCLGCSAGGDWQVPVYFIIYWDGKKLRGYVPTKGNAWNTDSKEAYGDGGESDYLNACKRWPELASTFVQHYHSDPTEATFDTFAIPDMDFALVKQDIMDRIHPRLQKEKTMSLGMWGE